MGGIWPGPRKLGSFQRKDGGKIGNFIGVSSGRNHTRNRVGGGKTRADLVADEGQLHNQNSGPRHILRLHQAVEYGISWYNVSSTDMSAAGVCLVLREKGEKLGK